MLNNFVDFLFIKDFPGERYHNVKGLKGSKLLFDSILQILQTIFNMVNMHRLIHVYMFLRFLATLRNLVITCNYIAHSIHVWYIYLHLP